MNAAARKSPIDVLGKFTITRWGTDPDGNLMFYAVFEHGDWGFSLTPNQDGRLVLGRASLSRMLEREGSGVQPEEFLRDFSEKFENWSALPEDVRSSPICIRG